jgi:XTP/dITP diphosphohydrolase
MQKLLIATHNRGKVREYQALLSDLPLAVLSLDEASITTDIEETGQTFYENALLKAEGYARLSNIWAWADDSGLEVDALGGKPGIYSARYGGTGLNDAERYQRLLADLQPFPKAEWSARFRCVVVVATPEGDLLSAEATVEGFITDAPRGANGFGYDPIFYMPSHQATMAELSSSEKNQISHRAKAAGLAKQQLQRWFQS